MNIEAKDYYNGPKEFIRANIEIPTLEKFLKPHLSGKRLLDIGCGDGQFYTHKSFYKN